MWKFILIGIAVFIVFVVMFNFQSIKTKFISKKNNSPKEKKEKPVKHVKEKAVKPQKENRKHSEKNVVLNEGVSLVQENFNYTQPNNSQDDFLSEDEDFFSQFENEEIIKNDSINPYKENNNLDDFDDFSKINEYRKLKTVETSIAERIRQLPPDIQILLIDNVIGQKKFDEY